MFAHILLAVWLLTPKIQFFLFLPPNQAASAARRHLHIFCANVEVHLRRTLCGVRWNVLLAPIFIGCSWLRLPNHSRAVVVIPSQWAKVHCARGGHIYSGANVRVHRRRLVRRTVERLVGLFIWFSAVLLWPIVLNVTVWSLFFALSMWKVHCTCGSLLFICPTSAFTFAPLVARNGGTPCWIPFSSAVPGFALRNRSRVVRDLCFSWWKFHCARGRQYIS